VYKQSVEAYQSVERTTDSPRDTEARVLTKGAMKLKWCRDNWDSGERKKRLAEALKYNQHIWSIFQADLISGRSPLPEKTRQNVLRLSRFVDHQILKAMAYPSPDKLTSIMNVNLGLAAGLKNKLPPSQASDAPEKPPEDGIETKG